MRGTRSLGLDINQLTESLRCAWTRNDRLWPIAAIGMSTGFINSVREVGHSHRMYRGGDRLPLLPLLQGHAFSENPVT